MTDVSLRELHWLPVKSRIKYKILLLTYQCLQGTAPTYLQDLIVKYTPSRNLRSRHKSLLVTPNIRTSQECWGFLVHLFSKSAKFGPHVNYTILFRFLTGAKKGAPRSRHIGKIQNGRHLSAKSSVVCKGKGLK